MENTTPIVGDWPIPYPKNASTFKTWHSVYMHTGQVAYGILLFGTIVVAWKIWKKCSNHPDSEAGQLKWANLFLLGGFLSSGLGFWFWHAIDVYFWYVLFIEIGNALYILGWMFLANGLNMIDRQIEEQQENITQKKKTPWHIIIGILAAGNAIVWILILSVGD